MVSDMKKIAVFTLILFTILFTSCAPVANYDIITTTLPVYDFTFALCSGTGLTVERLITESVSCLHDYSLKVSQMQMIESADIIIISGAGLEDFLADALSGHHNLIDASNGVHMHSGEHHNHDHEQQDHIHEIDPHIWLNPNNAAIMAENICSSLCKIYPEYKDTFLKNLDALLQELKALDTYGQEELSNLSCTELITFHDGFAYFAESFGLTILEAIEEESGSEASAAEIIHLVELVKTHHIPALFTEINGSSACAGIISAETDATIYPLDMAISGDSYFDAMYHNIDTVKEALK